MQPERIRPIGPPFEALSGHFSGLAPADFDVEAALKEIRHEWLSELDELS